MVLFVSLTGPNSAVTLQDAEVLDSLKVVVHGVPGDDRRLQDALIGVGRIEDSGDVLLEIDGLMRLSGTLAADPDWVHAFHQMIEYARSKGWVGPGETLRAHSEWDDPEACTRA